MRTTMVAMPRPNAMLKVGVGVVAVNQGGGGVVMVEGDVERYVCMYIGSR